MEGYFLSESRFFPLPSGHFNIAIEKTNVTRGTEHIVNRNTLDAILSDAILKNEVAVVNFSSLEKSKKLAPNSDIYGCVTIPTSDYVKEMENDADINALITAGCGVGKTLVDTMVIAQTRLGKMRSFVLLPSYVTSFAKEGEGVVRFSSVGYRGGEFFSASFDEARGRAYAFGMRKTSSKE